MRKLRVGVIGTGAFTEACHLPGLQSHSKAEVVALCGRDYGRTRSLADRFGVADVVTDYRDLCAREDVDAITIASRNVDHAPQAIAALRAKKHVLCEKPLATTVEDAREMVALADSAHKIHQVAFTYRYLYGVQRLRRMVLQGEIGDPHYVRFQHDTWQGLEAGFQMGFHEKLNLARGGMLFDVGSHFFDLARYLLGPIERLTGFTSRVPRQWADSHSGQLTEVETDDTATALFVYENGVCGQIFASRVTPASGPKGSVEVIGGKGALRALLSRGSVDVLQRSQPEHAAWEDVPLPEAARDGKPHCLGLMMQSFVEACCRGKLDGDVDASFHDGLAAQEGVAAVREAAGTLEWVRLKDQA